MIWKSNLFLKTCLFIQPNVTLLVISLCPNILANLGIYNDKLQNTSFSRNKYSTISANFEKDFKFFMYIIIHSYSKELKPKQFSQILFHSLQDSLKPLNMGSLLTVFQIFYSTR